MPLTYLLVFICFTLVLISFVHFQLAQKTFAFINSLEHKLSELEEKKPLLYTATVLSSCTLFSLLSLVGLSLSINHY